MIRFILAGFIALLLASCTQKPAENTFAASPEELHNDAHNESVVLAQQAEVQNQFGDDDLKRFKPEAPFQQVGFMLSATLEPELEFRTRDVSGRWSDWQAAELTHREPPLYNARAVLDEPATELELRGAQGLSYVMLEFFEETTLDSGPLARDLPLVTKPRQLDTLAAPANLVVSRADWGARATSCASRHSPRQVSIHHTAGPASESDPAATMRAIQAYHIDVRGWCDIGYHFITSHNGTVFQGRADETLIGSHVGGNNTSNVGVALMGNFETETLQEVQLGATADILSWLAETYAIPLNRGHVFGHRDFLGTSCPGENVYLRLNELVARAAGQTPVPTPLQPCDRSWPILRQGSGGNTVIALQYLLGASGLSDIGVDGNFGPLTQAAAEQFQLEQNLSADGVVGRNTWEALIRTLQQGDTGDAVRAAQTLLAVPVSGSFDLQTQEAVREAQRQAGLTIDGIVGPNTWAVLLGGEGCK